MFEKSSLFTKTSKRIAFIISKGVYPAKIYLHFVWVASFLKSCFKLFFNQRYVYLNKSFFVVRPRVAYPTCFDKRTKYNAFFSWFSLIQGNTCKKNMFEFSINTLNNFTNVKSRHISTYKTNLH